MNRQAAVPWSDTAHEIESSAPARVPAAVSDRPLFVSVVVPTFKRPDILARTIESLLASEYPAGFEVIVVDNGSKDATASVVQSYPAVRYIEQSSGGVAASRNAGARVAKGDVLIFVDDDIVVPRDMIRRQVIRLQQFRPCLVNGTWDFPADMARELAETPFGRFRLDLEKWRRKQSLKPLYENCFEAEAAAAYNLGVLREDFEKIGGFDETFPRASAEDLDFSLRAAGLGYLFVHDFDLHLLHNDRRMNFHDYCARQRTAVIGEALIARKHEGYFASRGVLQENGPVRRGDASRVIAKKLVKKVLASPLVLPVIEAIVRVTERVWPSCPLLPRAYWSVAGLYLYSGVQEGFARFGGPSPR